MNSSEIQYVSNQEGKAIAVIVPIELWKEIESERETAYLLGSETMKRRLLAAKNRQTGISLEDSPSSHKLPPIKRGKTAKDLLENRGKWQGDDLEKCLDFVIKTRSETVF